jgi:hypothetical protein
VGVLKLLIVKLKDNFYFKQIKQRVQLQKKNHLFDGRKNNLYNLILN